MSFKTEMIPTEKLFIDPMNVRVSEEFGDESDKMLGDNVKTVGQLSNLVVRPYEDGRFGVVGGRRTFLSAKDRLKEFRCVVKDMTDEEATEVSLSDNIFSKALNPVLRARAFKKLVDKHPKGAIGVARKMKIPKSTLSEWLSILDLEEPLQNTLLEGMIPYRDALMVARKHLSADEQRQLAETVKEKGKVDFKAELETMLGEHERRGAPVGLFVVRCVLPKDLRETYVKLAGDEDKVADYCEKVLVEHVKSKA